MSGLAISSGATKARREAQEAEIAAQVEEAKVEQEIAFDASRQRDLTSRRRRRGGTILGGPAQTNLLGGETSIG